MLRLLEFGYWLLFDYCELVIGYYSGLIEDDVS